MSGEAVAGPVNGPLLTVGSLLCVGSLMSLIMALMTGPWWLGLVAVALFGLGLAVILRAAPGADPADESGGDRN